MKANKAQQQAVLTVISRIYEQIRGGELALGIQVSPRDYRPRIEYFHDAVRALTQGAASGYEKTGRLSVESLAWDASQLREISNNPIARNVVRSPGSAKTDLVVQGAGGTQPRTEGEARYLLMDLYKNYTVLFVALLADSADKNFMNRQGENNAQVEDMAALMDAIRSAGKGEVDMAALIAENVADPELRAKLMAQLKGTRKAQQAGEQMKTAIREKDAETARIDKAHMHYLSSQLMVYEQSKDLVKKMLREGVNVVGDFLASAMAEAAGKGRGR